MGGKLVQVWEKGKLRAIEDRRRVSRSGRRHFDPKPTCPSCGLLTERPHGSDVECIAALREAIADRKRAL